MGTSSDIIRPNTQGAVTFFQAEHTLDCEFVISWTDVNNVLSIKTSSLAPYIGIVKEKCDIPSQAGGYSYSVEDNWSIPVNNDPRHDPPDNLNVIKRQAEGDSYRLQVLSVNISKPGSKKKVGPSLPSRSTYTMTQGEATSVPIGASFELSGGFFDIFSAQAGASFESTHTVENSQSTAIFVDCASGQNGQIYWTPKFDHNEGQWKPSGALGDVWHPLDGSAGDHEVECLG